MPGPQSTRPRLHASLRSRPPHGRESLRFSPAFRMEHTVGGQKRIVSATGIPNPGISDLEEYIVRHLDRYIRSFALAAALAAPALVLAGPHPQGANVQVRVYDRDHRDYHDWDDREDHAYRRYLVVRHRSYRDYHRQNYRVRRHYWNWRHSHPDRD